MESGGKGKGWSPPPTAAFKYLLAVRMCSVFFMHISDCDETYNYWEPVSQQAIEREREREEREGGGRG